MYSGRISISRAHDHFVCQCSNGMSFYIPWQVGAAMFLNMQVIFDVDENDDAINIETKGF